MEPSAEFALACTDEAQRELEDLASANAGSVIALLYARRNAELQERWYIGYYDSDELPATGVFCDIGSLRVFFPQGWLLPKLSGQVLRLIDGKFVIE
jgi:hypothetical protein